MMAFYSAQYLRRLLSWNPQMTLGHSIFTLDEVEVYASKAICTIKLWLEDFVLNLVEQKTG